MQEEVQKTVEFFKQDLDRPTSMKMRMNIPILNALWKLVTGETYDYDDPRLLQIVDKISLMMSSSSNFGAISLFPWLKHVIPEATGYNTVIKSQQAVYDLIEEQYMWP